MGREAAGLYGMRKELIPDSCWQQGCGKGGSVSMQGGDTEGWWETRAGSAVGMPQHLCKSPPAAAQVSSCRLTREPLLTQSF